MSPGFALSRVKRLAALVALLMSCAGIQQAVGADGSPDLYRDDDYGRVDKIDAHVHLHGPLSAFMQRAVADRFRLLTINVNYSDFPTLDVQLRDAGALQRMYPQSIAFVATFDAANSDALNSPMAKRM